MRPPGHHADFSNCNGYCIYNNVAIASKYAQQKYSAKKVAIFDWDIHAGDGTSKIFYQDSSVLYISIHRYDEGDFYPFAHGDYKNIGESKGEGYNVHFAFDAYDQRANGIIGDKDYIYAC